MASVTGPKELVSPCLSGGQDYVAVGCSELKVPRIDYSPSLPEKNCYLAVGRGFQRLPDGSSEGGMLPS